MADPKGASPKKPPVVASLTVSQIGVGFVGMLAVTLGDGSAFVSLGSCRYISDSKNPPESAVR